MIRAGNISETMRAAGNSGSTSSAAGAPPKRSNRGSIMRAGSMSETVRAVRKQPEVGADKAQFAPAPRARASSAAGTGLRTSPNAAAEAIAARGGRPRSSSRSDIEASRTPSGGGGGARGSAGGGGMAALTQAFDKLHGDLGQAWRNVRKNSIPNSGEQMKEGKTEDFRRSLLSHGGAPSANSQPATTEIKEFKRVDVDDSLGEALVKRLEPRTSNSPTSEPIDSRNGVDAQIEATTRAAEEVRQPVKEVIRPGEETLRCKGLATSCDPLATDTDQMHQEIDLIASSPGDLIQNPETVGRVMVDVTNSQNAMGSCQTTLKSNACDDRPLQTSAEESLTILDTTPKDVVDAELSVPAAQPSTTGERSAAQSESCNAGTLGGKASEAASEETQIIEVTTCPAPVEDSPIEHDIEIKMCPAPVAEKFVVEPGVDATSVVDPTEDAAHIADQAAGRPGVVSNVESSETARPQVRRNGSALIPQACYAHPAPPDRAAGGPGSEASKAPDVEPGKLRNMQEFWGKKESVGFVGKQMDATSRVTKGEAEVTLQRLIASGGAVDFNEVRRLRKLIAGLDS